MYEKSHVNAIRYEGTETTVETDRDADGVPHGVISALVYLALSHTYTRRALVPYVLGSGAMYKP